MIEDADRQRGNDYEQFFGFSEAPFSLAPNTRFLFGSASQAATLAQVTSALERREPLVVVTGEIGTGKTLLCRTVIERLERKTFLSIINDPQLDQDDLLKQMLQDFGVISKDRTRIAPTSRHDLVHALQEFLLSLVPLQAHAVLIVDEAQHLQPSVLEQIRLISNIHDDRGTMLQIILVGQPDLGSLLARPELRQLQQRVSRHVRLESLRPSEVADYVTHRLAIGRTTDQKGGVTFTAAATAAVADLSSGIPRVINLLCDRALELAWGRELHTVDAPLIEAAARELQLVEPAGAFVAPAVAAAPAKRRRLMLAASLAIAAAALWFGTRTLSTGGGGSSPSPGTTAAEATRPAAPSEPMPPPEPVIATAPPDALRPGTVGTGSSVGTSESPGDLVDAAGGFEIVVASFRTASRAAAVADSISDLGLPVRRRVSNQWQQVLSGPFASRDNAEKAQEQIGRAGFAGSQIVPADR